jgi:hypothetical protein
MFDISRQSCDIVRSAKSSRRCFMGFISTTVLIRYGGKDMAINWILLFTEAVFLTVYTEVNSLSALVIMHSYIVLLHSYNFLGSLLYVTDQCYCIFSILIIASKSKI